MRTDATACDGSNNKNTKQEENNTKKTPKAKADAFAEFAGENADLLKALREFSSMRSQIKKPLTPAAQTRLLSKLKSFPESERIPILNQSVDHCWQDIYALKKEASPAPANKPASRNAPVGTNISRTVDAAGAAKLAELKRAFNLGGD